MEKLTEAQLIISGIADRALYETLGRADASDNISISEGLEGIKLDLGLGLFDRLPLNLINAYKDGWYSEKIK